MRDARPCLVLLSLQALAVLALALWWSTQPVSVRHLRLLAVARTEAAATLPPVDLLAQARWLVAHRQARLAGVAGLLVLAVLLGGSEGSAQRQRDVRGGFRFARWTCGVVCLALGPALVAAWLLLPWPLTGVGLGMVWLAYGIVTSWCLTSGRPYVA